MLYVNNQDKPGFIGALGRTLGDAGINIATFHLGRDRPGDDAIALVEVDQPLRTTCCGQVQALPHVLQVRQLSFSRRRETTLASPIARATGEGYEDSGRGVLAPSPAAGGRGWGEGAAR